MQPHMRVTPTPGRVSGTTLYEAIDDHGRPVPGPRVALVGLVHGNEPVGGFVLGRLAEHVGAQLVRGSILAVRANERAAEEGARYSAGGVNLNRLWDAETLERLAATPDDARCYEHRRALELAPLLVGCDAILDLHSTTRPSPPFLVLRDDQRHLITGYRLRVDRMVTGLHESAILGGGMCPDVGLRRGARSSRLGFTLEAGQHDDPANAERAWDVATRLLASLGVWATMPPDPPRWVPEVFEVIDRVVQAPAGTEPYRFVGYVGGEPGGGRRGPRRKLASFEDIEAGEILMRRGHTAVLRAQYDFNMLLPTPAAEPGDDLYYIAQRRETGMVADGGVRSHDQAFREAQAVERVLDVLSDDAYGRGETYVCFDARMALDLCAEMLGRTLRMPMTDPHRRVAIVGRGDWGSGDAERRAGRRYRHALRRVIAEGVPSERFQLMRGATLGWIGQLTGDGMRGLLRLREASGPGGGAVPPTRVWLSERQPHTLSVVAVGDLGRAVHHGDTRHVRVGLIVEAASVEPDEGRAQVRVVRGGVFSSRPEIVHAVARLLEDLRAEHRHLMASAPLRDVEGLRALQVDDGALAPRPDAAFMAVLRQALSRLEAGLWRERIGPKPAAEVLPTPTDVGQWVARAAARTGILDHTTLRDVFVVPDGDGWRVDPDGLDRVLTDPASLAVTPPVAPALGKAPLLSIDVDADNLPAWLGWKRYLRTAAVVPDTRGKDLDLAFSAAGIRRRLVAWYRRARELAARSPGDVLVLVASDGAAPSADGGQVAAELHRAHLDLVLDPAVHYVRIQHAAGTHLHWLRDFAAAASRRPAGGAPHVFGWETEHGASASVILVATREGTVAGGGGGALNLDPWRLRATGVILVPARLRGGRDHRIGMFTDRLMTGSQRVNDELLQFGRAHAARLAAAVRDPVVVDGGPRLGAAIERAAERQLARWVGRSRYVLSEIMPPDADPRRWLTGHLRLADPLVTELLVEARHAELTDAQAAAAAWQRVREGAAR